MPTFSPSPIVYVSPVRNSSPPGFQANSLAFSSHVRTGGSLGISDFGASIFAGCLSSVAGAGVVPLLGIDDGVLLIGVRLELAVDPRLDLLLAAAADPLGFLLDHPDDLVRILLGAAEPLLDPLDELGDLIAVRSPGTAKSRCWRMSSSSLIVPPFMASATLLAFGLSAFVAGSAGGPPSVPVPRVVAAVARVTGGVGLVARAGVVVSSAAVAAGPGVALAAGVRSRRRCLRHRLRRHHRRPSRTRPRRPG